METSTITMRVSKHDCDERGDLYYGAVNVFFQQGEEELFRTEKGSKRIFREKYKLAYVCLGVHWEMFASASYDELLRVVSHIEDLRDKTYYLVHEVYRGDTRELVARGWLQRICVSTEGGKIGARDIPDEVRDSIRHFAQPPTSVPVAR